MKTNEDKSLETTNKIYSKICSFYNKQMIFVPDTVFNIIHEEVKSAINQECPNKHAVKSLNYMARRVKARNILSVILDHGTEKVWTIEELAKKTHTANSGIHKLKHRLLYLGLVDPSDTTKGMTRFKLNQKGKEEIERLNNSN